MSTAPHRSGKPHLYSYVGPEEIAQRAMNTARTRVESFSDVLEWAKTQAEPFIATFVVDALGQLWVADRHSEHVACARGEAVQTAGELLFELQGVQVEVAAATNQSTGFCPQVESWGALQSALEKADLPFPDGWTQAFEFRRCLRCNAINIVKEDWFVCLECDAELPLQWNMQD